LHAKALGEIQTKVRDHIEKHGRLSIKDGIEELGIGRTQAIFILEYLDSIGFTIRLGDYRILKSSKCAQIPEIMHADSCK
ncbi:MAG: SelB C-terminal domain-containing protein, partial [Candidatus Bathyarchaeia archaeon]